MTWFPVDPHDVTAEWLSGVLGAEVRACYLEQIGVGVGLLGRLYRAHLTGGPGIPESVVVKMPTLDQQARSALAENLEFYLSEVRFYQDVGMDTPLPPARPYYAAIDEATHDFILVLEDLGRLRVTDQNTGCAPSDAAAVIDALASHHAHWWESGRLATLPWLKNYSRPHFRNTLIGNFERAWPRFLECLGDELSPDLLDFGERIPALLPWYLDQVSRHPHTFLHGDLRLDQLFFGVGPDDFPVRAVDWQLTLFGRGAYDLGYFLSQSLDTTTRRCCEAPLMERYRGRLAERGIDYPADELRRDYRLTVAACFIYPVIAAGGIDIVNDRQRELLRTMLHGAASAIDDNDALAVRPD